MTTTQKIQQLEIEDATFLLSVLIEGLESKNSLKIRNKLEDSIQNLCLSYINAVSLKGTIILLCDPRGIKQKVIDTISEIESLTEIGAFVKVELIGTVNEVSMDNTLVLTSDDVDP